MLFIRCLLNLCKFKANIVMLRPSSISYYCKQLISFCSVLARDLYLKLKHIYKCSFSFLNIFVLQAKFSQDVVYALDYSRSLSHSFTHTLPFDLLSLQITLVDDGITVKINEAAASLQYSSMLTVA